MSKNRISVNKYKIIYKKPWFWKMVVLFNPNAEWGDVTLAFGDTIYTHSQLSEHELAHELVHLKQDHYSKLFAVYSIIRCNFDKKYYLKCETEAYQEENKLMRNPQFYARCLSSPVYNNLISYEEALKLFI